MKTHHRARAIALRTLALAAACGLAACSTPEPQNRPLGAAKQAIQQRQTQNPDAGQQQQAPEGVGAGTAAAILTNYRTNQSTEVQERRQDRQRDRGISEIGQDE